MSLAEQKHGDRVLMAAAEGEIRQLPQTVAVRIYHRLRVCQHPRGGARRYLWVMTKVLEAGEGLLEHVGDHLRGHEAIAN